MPKGKRKRPRDPSQLGKFIVDVATGEVEESESELSVKRSAAGKKGARSRSAALTPQQRSDIARRAAKARWARGNRKIPTK